MKILVTGGAGFIGSHIVDSLVAKGHKVVVYDNFTSGQMENLVNIKDDVEIIEGDILDYKRLEKAMKGVEVVSHQAAQLEIIRCIADPIEDLKINTVGTLNVLKAAVKNGVQKLINASSACVYGQAKTIPQSEDHPTNPNWAYGVSKLAAEKYCQLFREIHPLSTISLRYSIVYGVREWCGRALTTFIKRVLEGNPPIIFGEGKQIRDFIYVSDVVGLHNVCLENDMAGNVVYNVSTRIGTNLKELAEMVIEVSGKELEPVYEDIKGGEYSSLMPFRIRLPAELKTMILSPKKAKKELNWIPRISLKSGIKMEWDWISSNPKRWLDFRI